MPRTFIDLVGHLTHICSILVRSTEWGKIEANLPWLLDAVACVLLDLFVSFSKSFIGSFSLLKSGFLG